MSVDISKIDKNFLAGSRIDREDIQWISILSEPIAVHGLAVAEEDKFFRLPEEIVDRVNEGICVLGRHTAGGRIRFRTDSSCIAYRAKLRYKGGMPHMPLTGSAGTDIFVNGKSCTTFRPNSVNSEWYEGILEIGADVEDMQGMKDIEMNMGLYNGITEGWIGLKKGSILEAPAPYAVEKPIVYYGNSVTQGGCASKPGNSFPAFLGRWLNADHINLGFSGSGRGEEIMARYIASLSMSLFFMDYDHNAPTAEHLRNTHYPFYKIVREAQPNLPIIMASMPNKDLMPAYRAERREIIRQTYERARAEGDEKVWFVDGTTLFGEERDACTMDGAHPNDLGFWCMAKSLLPHIREALRGTEENA
jgi:lysophospholipase L1-like esterase